MNNHVSKYHNKIYLLASSWEFYFLDQSVRWSFIYSIYQ